MRNSFENFPLRIIKFKNFTMKKSLIICHSEHHYNTKKIAKEIARIINADLISSYEKIINLDKYNIIGFGSGIYYGRFHDNIYKIIESFPYQDSKPCFIFTTTGSKRYSKRGHELIKEKLKEKGFKIIGEFSCLGYDTALSSEGTNLGHPNEEDFRNAREFAEKLLRGPN